MPVFQNDMAGTLQQPTTSSASSSPINPNLSSRNKDLISSPTRPPLIPLNRNLDDDNFASDDSKEDLSRLISKPAPVQDDLPVSGNKTPSSSDMLYYYERLLPFRYIFQWLNHSPKPQKDFTMREFAYEYRSGAYQRYNSFATLEDFKASVMKANPTRFEVGAVYAVNPKDRKTLPKTAMKPLEKELVIDIDLTDYDDIRTCCSKTQICTKCWKFITVATKIIEQALREDFGFEHMVWVFSGRRGAHCWVSDKRARHLEEPKRRAIVEYLDILKNKGNKRLNLRRPYHPHIERSYEILKPEFLDIILTEQDPWADDVKAEELLKSLPDKNLNDALRKLWSSSPGRSSIQKWKDIDETSKKIATKTFNYRTIVEAKQDIILETMYPRLDVEVTRQMIHLLKSPFCIHPSTGNVCVPFDASQGFDPTNSPNLRQIQHEINKWEIEHQGIPQDKKLHDWDKTSLKPSVDLFAKFVQGVIKSERSAKRERDDDEEDLEF
ncbi:DNA primase small subunit [Wickerhamomyces ciferrii]|uniref:DNA primase n=1 Tax=Wickerhamomyces ciferrii (strain ATCC 14091 / BCRC 22168 / CBS 111 / JCM 3599 / NBRC 0793 / NRRL Y-1031 F-60-10) TaxID=1206466 RepID=K0KJ35_WICCF|nr:DNA primase small subunit [Wickerhamomyces ciferrii]CCH41489.1 DNA primase small subunit [Wickerhamomyces ciferrii]